ncbi:hypothetical protein [Streptomyces sp. GQFP]|uniref:hypothetical protein n=1 Tax=Streptomyces sp. GQFP TaxID=2907545 RepID=UPI001F48E57C|nr:hypothetical protein [Streptomyces sp. GQFP]UIX29549.1 hypothetical protein LUX31_05590 [Streptomyces sp. GQFP]
MTATLRACRYCDGLITDPEDAVEVAYEHVNSGPGRTVWAHRAHADLVDLIDLDVLRILTRIWAHHLRDS